MFLFVRKVQQYSRSANVFFHLSITLAYMAPELAVGKADKVSKASDVYAMAISMYEILSKCSSPWEHVLSVFSDIVLKDKLIQGCRPNVIDLGMMIFQRPFK